MRPRHAAGLSARERRTSIMRRTLLATIATGALLMAGLHGAHAFGHGGPGSCGRRSGMAMGEGPGMLPLPLLLSVMTPDQRARLGDVMKAEKPAMRSLFEKLRTAHEELADRVFAPGKLTAADLDPQVKKMAVLRDQLVQQALATTLKVRELLTPQQLVEAAKKKSRLRELGQEMRGLLPEPDEDPSE